MATQILPIADTVATSGAVTFDAPTLVWLHGSNALDLKVAVNAQGSDGLYSPVAQLGGGLNSGVLPAGTYQFHRLKGRVGVQHA